MKNAIIVALGLVCAALILSSATSAERTFEGGGNSSGGNDSVPVAVQNFPASQVVTGTVDIRTFPHTVNVQGTVDVGNLPIDDRGNVKVSGIVLAPQPPPPTFGFAGVTRATFPVDSHVWAVSNACNDEFRGTRLCEIPEFFRTIPLPPEAAGPIAMWFINPSSAFGPVPALTCFGADIDFGGTNCSFTGEPFRAACCGF